MDKNEPPELFSSDVQGLSKIFVANFDFKATACCRNYALMNGRVKFFIVIIRIEAGAQPGYPDSCHAGFMLDELHAVRAQHEALQQSGESPAPLRAFDARWTAFHLPAGDGISIEVNAWTKPA